MAARLAEGVVVVLTGPRGDVETFDHDSTDIPDWAAERMGDHCWADGKQPAAAKKAAVKADKE